MQISKSYCYQTAGLEKSWKTTSSWKIEKCFWISLNYKLPYSLNYWKFLRFVEQVTVLFYGTPALFLETELSFFTLLFLSLSLSFFL